MKLILNNKFPRKDPIIFGLADSSKFLNSTNSLETLILQGNPLKNEGLGELVQILYGNSSLDEINLNNILFGNDPEKIVTEFSNLMSANKNIQAYHLKFNFINVI